MLLPSILLLLSSFISEFLFSIAVGNPERYPTFLTPALYPEPEQLNGSLREAPSRGAPNVTQPSSLTNNQQEHKLRLNTTTTKLPYYTSSNQYRTLRLLYLNHNHGVRQLWNDERGCATWYLGSLELWLTVRPRWNSHRYG